MSDPTKLAHPKRNFLEQLILVLVMVVVASLVGVNVYYQRQDTKQRALTYELQIIRSSINLFKIVEKRNPRNLKELAAAVYTFPGDRETKKFLINVPFDNDGSLVDPFGNSFFYDANAGWVRSGTPGYEMW